MANVFLELPIIMFIVGIVFICIRKLRTAGRIITAVSASVLIVYAAVLAFVTFSIFGGSPYLSDAIYVIPIILITLFLIPAVCFGLLAWRKKWGRTLSITFSALALAAFLIPAGIAAYNESIPVVAESSTAEDYDPYDENSKIVVLDEEASFRLDGDYPVLDGATALYPVYSAFFRAVYPEEKFREDTHRMRDKYLRLSTTTGAYMSIVEGNADIIFVASASEEQKQYAEKRGVELEFIPIGSEAFVFFVNEKNPLDDISLADVRRIYTGEITKWSDLGVDGLGEIVAFQRDEGSGSQTAIENLIGKENLMEAPGREIAGMGEMIYRVADYKNFKNAIGYSFRYYTTVMNKNSGLKVLSLNGVEPTAETIKSGTYPVAGNFYAVIRSDAGENVRGFIDWMLSDEGQKIIEETGYVPLN